MQLDDIIGDEQEDQRDNNLPPLMSEIACAVFLVVCMTIFPFKFQHRTFTIGLHRKKIYTAKKRSTKRSTIFDVFGVHMTFKSISWVERIFTSLLR